MSPEEVIAAIAETFGDLGRSGMRGAARALTGIDPDSGDDVSQTERFLTLIGGALPLAGVGARTGSAARMVAGRGLDGVERGLSPHQVERLAGLLTDGIGDLPASAIAAGERGALTIRRAGREGAGGRSMRIDLDPSLSAGERARVLAHETGHAIDETAGLSAGLELAPGAVARGLRDLSRAHRPELWRDGAAIEEPAEWAADALARYLIDPAGTKRAAPVAAAWLRRSVNADPAMSRHLRLNGSAAGGAPTLWEE